MTKSDEGPNRDADSTNSTLKDHFSRLVRELQSDRKFMAKAYFKEVRRVAMAPIRALARNEVRERLPQQTAVHIPATSWSRAEELLPYLENSDLIAAADVPDTLSVVRLALFLGLNELERTVAVQGVAEPFRGWLSQQGMAEPC